MQTQFPLVVLKLPGFSVKSVCFFSKRHTETKMLFVIFYACHNKLKKGKEHAFEDIHQGFR